MRGDLPGAPSSPAPSRCSANICSVTRYSTIETVVEGHVGHLRLAREERLNAMNPAFFADLEAGVRELSENEAVRAIVLSAQGPHFSVGLDLKESNLTASAGSPAATARGTYRHVKELQRAFDALAEAPQPTIAAVHGYCIGGGIDLIACCDIRLAAEDSVFSIREARIAIVADLGSLQRLPRIVPRGHLMELALTAEDFGTGRAERIGLINRVLPGREETVAEAVAVAERISANSPLATLGTKEILRGVYDADLAGQLDRVALWNSAFIRSADLEEAFTAFLQKREPRFKGE